MEPTSIKEYYGVPVFVQLRAAIAQMVVDERSRGKLPYAADPKQAYWVPLPTEEGMATPFVALAVLYPVSEAPTTVLEMRWTSVPAKPSSGAAMGQVVTLATLIDSRDIYAITRVVDVPPEQPSSLILRA